MQRRTSALDGIRHSTTQPPVLNEDEHVIVGLLAQGFSNGEICMKVAASRATIDRGMRALVRKLYARNRVEAVATAIRSGLI